MTTPADVVNRALDGCGRSDIVIGELGEGTEGAKPALRAYGPAFRQLLRSAHWSFARKMAPLTLLADATGQTPNVGTVVVPTWAYEYALPIDCVKARFVPWNNQQGATGAGAVTTLAAAITSTVQNQILLASILNFPLSGEYNIVIDSETMTVLQGQGTPLLTVARGVNSVATTHAFGATVTMVPIPPLMPNLGVGYPYGLKLIPAPFLLSTDYNYPVVVGTPSSWDSQPQWWQNYGEGPQQRTVVLTNVKNASMVYTALIEYPSQWDDLFTEALVELLTARLALPLNKDKKFGLELQTRAIANFKQMLIEARLVSANESGFPQKADLVVDWMRNRRGGSAAGAGWGGQYNGFGGWGIGCFGGYDSIGVGDGSVF